MSCWKYKVITKHRPKGYLFKDFVSACDFCRINKIAHVLIKEL